MTFQELQNLIDENFNTNKLADIARELDVSPQVVSNWKSRDQVPYKYVKLIRKKIKDLNEADLRDNLKNINPYQRAVNIITSSSKDDNEEEIDLFNLIAKFFLIIKEFWKTIIGCTIICTTYVMIKVTFFDPIIFISSATILPNSGNSSQSQMAAMAQQFGLSINNNDDITISSPKLLPDIMRSRRLSVRMLEKKFTTKKFGKDQTLLKILTHGDSELDSSKFHEYQNRGIKRFNKMIDISIRRSTPLLVITARAFEAEFASELVKSIIDEITTIQNLITQKTIIEKKEFVQARIDKVGLELKQSEEILRVFKEKNRNIQNSPLLLLEEARLQRNVIMKMEIFTTLKTEFEIIQIEKIGTSGSMVVLDVPNVPLKRTSPRRTESTIIGFFTSIMIGIILALGQFWVNRNWENKIKPILKF